MDIDIILVSFTNVRLFDCMDVHAVAAYASLYNTYKQTFQIGATM